MRPIILALPKGRILDEAANVFATAGYDLSPVFADNRKLVHECGVFRVLVLRNSDIATYVHHGAADIGIAGSDVLDEEGRELYEPLDLGIGRCRMIVAERADQRVDERAQAHIRIATKYPRTTRAYLCALGANSRARDIVDLPHDVSGYRTWWPHAGRHGHTICQQAITATACSHDRTPVSGIRSPTSPPGKRPQQCGPFLFRYRSFRAHVSVRWRTGVDLGFFGSLGPPLRRRSPDAQISP